MAIETTLILFKTDCIEKSLVGEVLRRYEAEGFKIRGIKMMQLSSELLQEHYAHIADEPFFPEIANFMQASPIIAMALSGENAIARIRELLGPTDSTKAEKGTIRGDFGVDMMTNICHASDSRENAAAEVKRFFSETEIFDY